MINDMNKTSLVYNKTTKTLDRDLLKLQHLGYIRLINNQRKVFSKISKKQRCIHFFKEDRELHFIPTDIDIERLHNLSSYYKYRYIKDINNQYSIYNHYDELIKHHISGYEVLNVIQRQCKIEKFKFNNIISVYGMTTLDDIKYDDYSKNVSIVREI